MKFSPRAADAFVVVTAAAAYAIHVFLGAPFWATWLIVAIAVLVNGWIAAVEDGK